jgi:hypothetical protein
MPGIDIGVSQGIGVRIISIHEPYFPIILTLIILIKWS